MELSVEFKGYEQSFRTMIAGVTKQNTDGTDRQALIKALSLGEELRLVREPSNPYDRYAVAVLRASGEQLGYVPAGDRRLADHIDMGG
jgi:HIRAN domain